MVDKARFGICQSMQHGITPTITSRLYGIEKVKKEAARFDTGNYSNEPGQ